MSTNPTLSELLTNSRPNLATGKALLALDLQADFLCPDGKLPVTLLDGFRRDFAALVSSFRQSGQIIWVNTQYEEARDVSGDAVVIVNQGPNTDDDTPDDEDSEDEFIRTTLNRKSSPLGNRPSAMRTAELLRRAAGRTSSRQRETLRPDAQNELFLTEQSDPSRQCCVPHSEGAEVAPIVKSLQDPSRDLVALKRSYSAFNSTSLLMALRLRMITHLYICGSLTNISVYATATAAVGHGFQVTVIDDCLGYRNRSAHEQALKKMVHVIGAERISAAQLNADLYASLLAENGRGQVLGNGEHTTDATPTMQMQNLSLSSENLAINLNSTGSNLEPIPTQGGVAVAASSSSRFSHSQTSRQLQRESPTTPIKLNERPTVSKLSTAGKPKTISAVHPIKKPGDKIGEGDSSVVYNMLPRTKSDLFTKLKNEVHWQKMLHAHGEVPRLVCVQGVFGQDGSMPVYRHPSDQSLPLLHFSPNVLAIKAEVESIVGHPMNHVLIQLYRSGEDHISEHSDKTLDIVRGSSIVNVSLGAQRTMRLRTKRSTKTSLSDDHESSRRTELVPLPHGSMFILGLQTNKYWLHGINHDKRPMTQRSAAEIAFGCERISLTFRQIGTFLDSSSQRIWGQGVYAKYQSESRPVINGDPKMTQQIINAFGYENQQTSFAWDKVYGKGFDVLHFSDPPLETPLFFPSGNYVKDMRVKIFLEELGFTYRVAGVARADAGADYSPEMCLRDVDAQKTQVYGDVPILLYLARTDRRWATPEPLIAESCSQLWELRDMLTASTPHSSLAKLEAILDGREYIAGDEFSIADCAYFPVIDEIIETWEPWNSEEFPNVTAYHERTAARPSVRLATWSDAAE